jgi:hypothetical protein
MHALRPPGPVLDRDLEVLPLALDDVRGAHGKRMTAVVLDLDPERDPGA